MTDRLYPSMSLIYGGLLKVVLWNFNEVSGYSEVLVPLIGRCTKLRDLMSKQD